MSKCKKVTKLSSPFDSAKKSELIKTPKDFSKLDIQQQAAISGMDGSSNPSEESVDPVKSSDEKITAGPASTFVSLGRDRPAEIGTGYEGSGDPNAGAIWICSGMSSAIIDKSPKDNSDTKQKFNRNFNLDASFIYISSKADIDKYLGLSKGRMGNYKDSAAIAIKSSDLRLVARNGIKLVTNTDPVNEKGGSGASIVGIEIIAGNDDSTLQPMVKGANLASALKRLSDQISKIIGTMQAFAKHQNDFNRKLKDHTHPDVLNMLVGILANGDATSITDGETLENLGVLCQGELTEKFIAEVVLADCARHKRNLVKFEKLYLGGSEKTDINSKYNKVN